MIDFSFQIEELDECSEEFKKLVGRLSDLHPGVSEKDFSIMERYSLASRIILTRFRIANVVDDIINAQLDQDISVEDAEALMSGIELHIKNDEPYIGVMIMRIVESKSNKLAFALIKRYIQILGNMHSYCCSKSPNKSLLDGLIAEIEKGDMNLV